MRCHNCNSYCCSTRPVPSHDSYLRDRCHVAMIRTCNAFWAGDYYPVVQHRCDLMDPYCGAPGSSSSWDPSDPTTVLPDHLLARPPILQPIPPYYTGPRMCSQRRSRVPSTWTLLTRPELEHDWLGKRARPPHAAYFPHARRCSFYTGAPHRSGASGHSTWFGALSASYNVTAAVSRDFQTLFILSLCFKT